MTLCDKQLEAGSWAGQEFPRFCKSTQVTKELLLRDMWNMELHKFPTEASAVLKGEFLLCRWWRMVKACVYHAKLAVTLKGHGLREQNSERKLQQH